MGLCLSFQTKPDIQSPFNSGLNSKRVSGDTHDFFSTSSKVSSDFSSLSSKNSLSLSSSGSGSGSSNLKSFTSTELKAATRNFCADSVLGEGNGGFGSVYKGWIDDHSHSPSTSKHGTAIVVAIRRLNHDAFQGHNEWLAQVNYISQLSHPHLVKLIGYCLEDENRFMVYELMPRGSLENHLFRRGSYFQPLSWSLRLKVALGAAKGLAFLHTIADSNILCRDFKTSNVLLDSNYNAKLCDFGPTSDKRHVSTYGYAAPEYLATGQHNNKSDVFSYGVVLLEILSGRRAIDKNRPEREHNLVKWAKPYLANKRKILRVLDNRLEGQCDLEEVYKVATLSLRCLSIEAKLRPNMDEVVTNLEQLQVPHVSNRNRLRRKSANDVIRVKTTLGAYPQPSTSLLLD